MDEVLCPIASSYRLFGGFEEGLPAGFKERAVATPTNCREIRNVSATKHGSKE
jgi:hypothetical protein